MWQIKKRSWKRDCFQVWIITIIKRFRHSQAYPRGVEGLENYHKSVNDGEIKDFITDSRRKLEYLEYNG